MSAPTLAIPDLSDGRYDRDLERGDICLFTDLSRVPGHRVSCVVQVTSVEPRDGGRSYVGYRGLSRSAGAWGYTNVFASPPEWGLVRIQRLGHHDQIGPRSAGHGFLSDPAYTIADRRFRQLDRYEFEYEPGVYQTFEERNPRIAALRVRARAGEAIAREAVRAYSSDAELEAAERLARAQDFTDGGGLVDAEGRRI